jgi:hypothetical protein
MNSAPTHHTATKAGPRALSASRVVLACALVQALVLGLGAAAPAFAQQHDRRDDGAGPPERHERFQLPPQDRDQRQAEMRAIDEQRRAQQQLQQQQDRDRRSSSSRLTPDERRDLRRQINEANMDLYPQRR